MANVQSVFRNSALAAYAAGMVRAKSGIKKSEFEATIARIEREYGYARNNIFSAFAADMVKGGSSAKRFEATLYFAKDDDGQTGDVLDFVTAYRFFFPDKKEIVVRFVAEHMEKEVFATCLQMLEMGVISQDDAVKNLAALFNESLVSRHFGKEAVMAGRRAIADSNVVTPGVGHMDDY